ncbi:hypothetical protein LCGC14_2308410, partial [marine sediment metagenome]
MFRVPERGLPSPAEVLHRHVKTALHGAQRHVEYLGNVLVRELLKVAQHNHHPQVVRHLPHSVSYGLGRLQVLDSFGRGRNICGHQIDEAGLALSAVLIGGGVVSFFNPGEKLNENEEELLQELLDK